MKKFIYFIFSSNIGELLTIFFGIIVGLPSPLTAIFLLIINTLTDVFPALALGIEPVERNILERPPRKSTAKIMERSFIQRYLGSGIFIGLLTTAGFIGNLLASGWKFGDSLEMSSPLYMASATTAFATLAISQMIHTFNSRSEVLSVFKMNPFSNPHLIAAVLFSTLSTIALIHIPFFNEYLKTYPLNKVQWLTVIGLSCGILIFEEIRKMIMHVSSKKIIRPKLSH